MPTPANALNISETGYQSFDGTSIFKGRTFQAGTGITITNPDGVAGNTTITANGSNDLHVAKWIVNQAANSGGNQTTIQSAINNAVSGETIFVMPGTYSENLTLKAGVNITAFTGDGYTGNVIINGNCTLSSAGTVTISGIQLKTNSANCITVSGSAASILYIIDCNINCLNNTGISYTTSNTGSSINITDSVGNIATTGIALFAMTSTGVLAFDDSNFTNTGASTTASTASAGSLFITNSTFSSPITTSSTNNIGFRHANFDTSAQNATALTHGGSGGNIYFSAFLAGSASAISIGGNTNIFNTLISSSNTNAITGAGTIFYGNLSFASSKEINTTTQSGGTSFGITNGVAPSTGLIGETISTTVADASVGLGNNTAATVASINITAGRWCISAICSMNNTGNATAKEMSIGTTNNTLTGAIGDTESVFTGAFPASYHTLNVQDVIVNLTGTTTYYMVGLCVFSTGGASAGGRITATRIG